MIFSTFNVENLFSRFAVMNLDTWADGRAVLTDIEKLNGLLAEDTYTASIKSKIKELLDKYEFNNRNKRDRPFEIVEVREKLYVIKKGSQEIDIKAGGRGDWVGWITFKREELKEEAINNTARVIAEIKADIQCVVEVEDRITLNNFNKQVLSSFSEISFGHNMLVDGNDSRGIDIGLLSRYPIISVRSHIDAGGENPIFSRDCPEFEVELSDSTSLWVLGNHLKSKGYGSQKESAAKRKKQATEVARIYNDTRKRSEYVIVAGDFNDSPDSDALQPLLGETDLKDVMSHQSYDGPPGTYGSCKSLKQKIDYILLSPALWNKVQRVGIERRGIYAPRSGELFDSVTDSQTAASDHAAVWVEIGI